MSTLRLRQDRRGRDRRGARTPPDRTMAAPTRGAAALYRRRYASLGFSEKGALVEIIGLISTESLRRPRDDFALKRRRLSLHA
jgi:hypothetical protein